MSINHIAAQYQALVQCGAELTAYENKVREELHKICSSVLQGRNQVADLQAQIARNKATLKRLQLEIISLRREEESLLEQIEKLKKATCNNEQTATIEQQRPTLSISDHLVIFSSSPQQPVSGSVSSGTDQGTININFPCLSGCHIILFRVKFAVEEYDDDWYN